MEIRLGCHDEKVWPFRSFSHQPSLTRGQWNWPVQLSARCLMCVGLRRSFLTNGNAILVPSWKCCTLFRAWGSCWLVSFLCCQGHWKYRSCLSDHLIICLSIWLSNENVDYRLKERCHACLPFLSIGPSDYLSVFLTIDCRLTIEIAVPVYRSCLTVPVNSRSLRCMCQSISIQVREGAFPG